MKMREMSISQLIEKFDIVLGENGTIRIMRGKSLYPAALNIIKERQQEITAMLMEEKEEGFAPNGYTVDEDVERDWNEDAAEEEKKWAEDDAQWARQGFKPAHPADKVL